MNKAKIGDIAFYVEILVQFLMAKGYWKGTWIDAQKGDGIIWAKTMEDAKTIMEEELKKIKSEVNLPENVSNFNVCYSISIANEEEYKGGEY